MKSGSLALSSRQLPGAAAVYAALNGPRLETEPLQPGPGAPTKEMEA